MKTTVDKMLLKKKLNMEHFYPNTVYIFHGINSNITLWYCTATHKLILVIIVDAFKNLYFGHRIPYTDISYLISLH